jgi:precorrin-6B methylase 2
MKVVALWLVAAIAMVIFGQADVLAIIVHKILLPLLAALLMLDIYNLVFHGNVPNIRTAPAIRKEIIGILKTDYESKKTSPYIILDLGSGSGLFTREIAAAIPQARIIGIEKAWHSVLWSRTAKRRAHLANLSYRKTSFLAFDITQADAIVMYLVPSLMDTLGKKLHGEAREGTLIISNKFRLGNGWTPIKTIRVKTFYPHQAELHIYRR